jgi:hypothetical protein
MSTTEDTSAIDEKKNEDAGTGGSLPDFKGFIKNYISSIVFTIGISIFIIGGLGLYTTKVAQSNILPDNIELAPYTIIDRIVENIPIDINIMSPSIFSEKDTISQKAIFNSQSYLDSFSNSLLCSLKDKAYAKGKSNAALFFSRIYDNLAAKNLLAINTIFFYLSYLPEPLIMILYGLFGIFIWIGLYFFNMCISIFYHFINIPELFRESLKYTDKNKNEIFEWESDDDLSFIRLFKLLLFFFIWIPVGLFSTFLTPIFFTFYGLISPLLATYSINKTKKTYGVYDFIIDTFAYKKLLFLILATLSLCLNGLRSLDNKSIIGLLIAVGFAYYMGFYSNEIPEVGSDGFTAKITEKIQKAKIGTNKTKLVEICPKIDIDDDKIKKIIRNGIFRKVTQPKETGGGIDYENTSTPTVSTPTVSTPTVSTPTVSTPTYPNDINDISPSALPIEQMVPIPPSTPIPPIEQMGGKIRKSLKTTKKYNIRLV